MSQRPIVYLSRKETFSACHRLHSKKLLDDDNASIYGKCNNPKGHGHNYTVKVTVRGTVNETTGMVMNIADLKIYINKVLSEFDHHNIDEDISHFRKGIISTTENVAIYIWERLCESMPKPELLYEIKVNETNKNSVTYRGA